MSPNAVNLGSFTPDDVEVQLCHGVLDAMGDPALERRTRLGPPGVDVARFAPRDAAAAQRGVRALAARLRATAPAPSGQQERRPPP